MLSSRVRAIGRARAVEIDTSQILEIHFQKCELFFKPLLLTTKKETLAFFVTPNLECTITKVIGHPTSTLKRKQGSPTAYWEPDLQRFASQMPKTSDLWSSLRKSNTERPHCCSVFPVRSVYDPHARVKWTSSQWGENKMRTKSIAVWPCFTTVNVLNWLASSLLVQLGNIIVSSLHRQIVQS